MPDRESEIVHKMAANWDATVVPKGWPPVKIAERITIIMISGYDLQSDMKKVTDLYDVFYTGCFKHSDHL